MYSSKTTMETGFCSIHRRKRPRVDLIRMDQNTDKMRCKPNKECRQRTESEMVYCNLHKRRRNIHQMKEVGKGVFECLPQYACRGQFNDASVPASNSNASFVPHILPSKGNRPQHISGDTISIPSVNVAWAPAFNRSRNVDLVTSSDWVQPDHKTWCAKHGKLSSQCELIKECCYICYDSSICLSTPLELPSDLLDKGCKELLCSKHNALRLVEFLERTPDKTGYNCIPGHRCRGTVANQREVIPEHGLNPTRDAVSSFFV